jgi:hypothetical protein
MLVPENMSGTVFAAKCFNKMKQGLGAGLVKEFSAIILVIIQAL